MSAVQSKNPVIARNLVDELLSTLSTRPLAAWLALVKVHLFTAGPANITPTSAVADFTEATFAGYASQTITLPFSGPVQVDAQNRAVFADANFIGGAVVLPGEVIQGYWVDNDDGSLPPYFILGEIFETPIPIAVPGDFILLDLYWPGREVFSLAL